MNEEKPVNKWAAFITGKHPFTFRCGRAAMITGVVYVTPQGDCERLCYEITFSDGFIDHVPVSEIESGVYEIHRYRTGMPV